MTILAVLVLYTSFLAIGWYAAKRTRGGTAADLVLAGRAMPLWLATLTMTATWVDGGYLLGTTEAVYKSSLALGIQGGLFFGLSLVLGGLFFAAPMRRAEYTTLIDPFEARFGAGWASVLALPATLGEVLWSAELLVAIGSTFGVVLGLDLRTSVLLCAAVVTVYTMAGGLWAVAYTDAFQLLLVVIGLVAALPYALGAVGGLNASWLAYHAARPDRGGLLPPFTANATFWTVPAITAWWDVSFMLLLGGIPWNCYFQRVLACRNPSAARWHSFLAGALTILLTAPPLLMGTAAFNFAWPADALLRLRAQPAHALPLLLQNTTPPFVELLGLAAIIGAVTSSYSASILSASAMFAWNVCQRLLRPSLPQRATKLITRSAIVGLSALAVILALEVQSVQALWFFTSDLVFVLLFPQLVCALFDRRANRTGSMAAFAVSLSLRLGGGEPLFHLPPLIPYPEMLVTIFRGEAANWYDAETGGMLFPFRTVAALAGLFILPVVSRLTERPAPTPRRLSRSAQALARD
ncbi:MAG: sodium:solute symporter family protein [Deltaproteobacteria bacterium]|nr:sodium:solute symporter family protein [Deltaproteobacteria bacterium]